METVLKYSYMVLSLPQLVTCANLTYIPYYVDKDGSCLSNEGGIGDLPSAMPLAKRLKHVLQDMHMTYKYVTCLTGYAHDLQVCWFVCSASIFPQKEGCNAKNVWSMVLPGSNLLMIFVGTLKPCGARSNYKCPGLLLRFISCMLLG